MKKFLPYILILIALAGFFSPVMQVRAQTTTQGICTIKFLFKSDEVYPGITNDRCDELGGAWTCPAPLLETNRVCVTPVPLVPNTNTSGSGADTNTTYTPLAPLPGFVDDQGNVEPFNTADKCAFGKYLNIMITLVIGLIAVGAVVMIVLGGMQYMTSELISSKEAGKEKIKNALLGLIIALGAYALLNTINPALLNTCFDLPVKTITIQDERETAGGAVISEEGVPPSTPTALCQVGIQRTTSGMYTCGSIAQNLDRMIVAARSAGHNITGGGYRTIARQEQLRRSNCNGNVTDRNARCSPPTAIPGASRHNNGLAFDLKCSGTLIQSQDNDCFVWLKANAGKFGLSNLPGEEWHWSTDGR